MYRGWGVDLVGMTNMPEAKLAREAELAYATLGLATDYDCWHESEEAVDVAAVVARVKTMVGHAKAIIVQLASTLGEVAESPAHTALQGAIMTSSLTDDKKQELGWLLGD